MPKAAEVIPTIWTTLWSDANNTGTWRTAIPVYQHRLSPCRLSCPVGGTIPVWADKLRNCEFYEAWSEIVANNPFPAVTGRVCHHPCESACNRSQFDEKVSIKLLERYLGDLALEKGWPLPEKGLAKKQRVAIIGGGPAGLSAAYQLALRGYRVEIFEAKQMPGGLLRYGIPPYRLPREVLDCEIDRLLQLGIQVHTGSAINGAEEYRRLQKDYDALFIATGARRPRKLHLSGSDFGIVKDGLDFLFQVNNGLAPKMEKKVIVIGGGNTAVDAARVARRLGAEQVTIVYRRTESEMPSQKSEILEAREEGVEFLFLASPVRIEKEADNGYRLICQKMRLGEKDASGRPRPEAVPQAYFPLEADQIIMAIGSDAVIPDISEQPALNGSLLKVDEKQETSVEGIFAGGDLTSTERFVSSALGAGKKAAEHIDQLWAGSLRNDNSDNYGEEAVTYKEVNTFYFSRSQAVKNNLLQATERVQNFQEVQLGISEGQALSEAARCFNCGLCVQCDNCFYFCPDMAVKKGNSGEKEYSILEQYCKGCGLCVKECPRGAIVLKEESK